jgi:hypothetical protein
MRCSWESGASPDPDDAVPYGLYQDHGVPPAQSEPRPAVTEVPTPT